GGFKSFADKTVLEYVPGASVIVGPNGSGKSNLVDAISWALGEQGPRALRGGHMADVIFAGSPARAALGMAEVKLVIDNSAGLIPVPMSELEISRAIFRSGESEYRIAGEVRRPLDIPDLPEEAAWRLAAARLKTLLENRESRSAGWQHGLAAREEAKAALQDVDQELSSLAADRERTARALNQAEIELERATGRRGDAERELR